MENLVNALEAHTEQDARSFAALDARLQALASNVSGYTRQRGEIVASAAKWGAVVAGAFAGAAEVFKRLAG